MFIIPQDGLRVGVEGVLLEFCWDLQWVWWVFGSIWFAPPPLPILQMVIYSSKMWIFNVIILFANIVQFQLNSKNNLNKSIKSNQKVEVINFTIGVEKTQLWG